MSARAIKVGDTILQLTDAVAIRDAGDGAVWFVTGAVAVRAKITLDEACKLLDWKVARTVEPG